MFGYHFLAQVAITGRVLRAPCSQRLVEEAGKGLGLGIGDVMARCSMLLKGFWHSGNLGDMDRSRSKDWKGVRRPLGPRVSRGWRRKLGKGWVWA